jgi:cytochrome o ubiquinol oxidase operon protein cyoD
MSQSVSHSVHDHAHHHGDHHDHHDHHDDHGSLKSYMIGFVLAVILTVIPFWLVMGNVIKDSSTAGIVILTLAAVQVVVHMVYFLHMNSKSEGGWNMLALVFTLLIVAIMLAGSIWVMYHMNVNMMPGMHSGSMSTM